MTSPLVRFLGSVLLAVLATAAVGVRVARAHEPAPIQIEPAAVPWRDAPATMPKGARIAVLEGDPQRPGLFTLRLLVPKGFRLPAHTHPQDERVTVLRGAVHVVLGEGASARDTRMPAGAFYVNPAHLPHVVYADEESELQITGWGPWEVRLQADKPAPAPK